MMPHRVPSLREGILAGFLGGTDLKSVPHILSGDYVPISDRQVSCDADNHYTNSNSDNVRTKYRQPGEYHVLSILKGGNRNKDQEHHFQQRDQKFIFIQGIASFG
jgi:hypothetical protein